MGQYTEPQTPVNEKEISFIDLMQFFFNNWKFLALTTAGVSAITITLSLLQPKPVQYQKQLTLSVRSTRVPVPGFPEMDDNQASSIAVKFLENPKLDQITAQTKYDPITRQIDLTLRASNANALNDADAKAVRQVETGFEQIVGKFIDTSLSSLKTQIQKNNQILNRLKQQSAQFSPTNQFRLGALETQQTQYLAALNSLEFDKQYLEQAKENLTEFTSQVISVQILAESEPPPQNRSMVQVVVIAIIASFMVAVFVTVIRDQILRLKHELSQQKPPQQKPHGSSSV